VIPPLLRLEVDDSRRPHGDGPGGSARFSDKADPGTTASCAARLNFYFLFYLLRIFKWPDSVILDRRNPDDHHGADARAPFVDCGASAAIAAPVAVVITILTVIAMGT
jgi:hypothetical protein